MITIIVSTLTLALLLMGLMCYNKALELQTGKGIVSLTHSTWDTQVANWVNGRKAQVKLVNSKTVASFFNNLLVMAENLFFSLMVKLGKRFSKVGDMITGKDLPKNRGSVSAFLMSIEKPTNSK